MEPKTIKQKEKLAKLLADEVPVTKALEIAGWSPTQAAKGWAKVPKDVVKLLPKKAKALIEKGRMNKRDLEHLVIGRLADNVVKGRDGGAQSAKILGSHREINAWTPDQQLGVIILGTPPAGLYRSLIERED